MHEANAWTLLYHTRWTVRCLHQYLSQMPMASDLTKYISIHGYRDHRSYAVYGMRASAERPPEVHEAG